TESLLIAFAGAVLGMLFAAGALAPLLRLAAGALPDVGGVHIDAAVLAFTAAAALITAILFGLLPALRTAQLDLRESLGEGGRGGTGGVFNRRLRSTLVVSEFAL